MFRILALVAGFLFAVVPGAHAKDIALVIGIDEYTDLPDLTKAREDASGYRELFESKGFEVHYLENASGVSIRLELARFYDRIEPGDTVVFVYSGHGWSDGSQNYLVPADTPDINSAMLAEALTIPLKNGFNGILDQIARQGAELSVAIIDACRDNPFSQAQTRTLGLVGGLAPVEAPSGTFIIYSAASGQTALDRLGNADEFRYSVFTRFFIPNLRDSGDLVKAVRTTRNQVQEAAAIIGHRQRPAYYDELNGGSCIFGTCEPVAPVSPPIQTPQVGSGASQAAFTWSLIQDSSDPQVFEAFVTKFGETDPIFVTLARSKLLEFAIESGLAVTLSTVGIAEPVFRSTVSPTNSPEATVSPIHPGNNIDLAPDFASGVPMPPPQSFNRVARIPARHNITPVQVAMTVALKVNPQMPDGVLSPATFPKEPRVSFPRIASNAIHSSSEPQPFIPQGFGPAYEEAIRLIEATPASAISLRLEIPGLSVIPAEIGRFTNLKVLSIAGTNVYSLSPIAGILSLESLDISGTNVAKLDALEGLSNLQTLRLDNTRVQSLAPIAVRANAGPAPQLRRLYFSNTLIADISPLKNLANLEYLEMDHTPVEDVSMLEKLYKLKRLSLVGTGVTDISMLRHLPHLAEPNIDETPLELLRISASTDAQQGKFYHALGNRDSEAVLYYRRAYDAYDWYALSAHKLGMIFYNSRSVAQDLDKAFALFSEGTEAGRADSAYYLGLMFERGEGTPVIPNEAARLYMLSLKRGSDLLISRARNQRSSFSRLVVERLQWSFRSRDLYSGAIDGVIGGQSIRAMQRYCEC